MKYRHKLTILLVVASLVPMVILAWYSHIRISSMSRRNAVEDMNSMLEQTREGIDSQIEVYSSLLNYLTYSPDIEEIIKERLQKKTSMGFNSELKDTYEHDENLLSKVTVEDLRKFGMIPEFLGRLPIIFTLKGLDKEMLVKILREPKNAILKQYQKLLALDEVKLDFDDSALEAIAEKAMEKDTGARALRAILQRG